MCPCNIIQDKKVILDHAQVRRVHSASQTVSVVKTKQ